MLRIIHRVIARFVLKQAGLKRCAADTGAVTLIERFGSAANLNIHLHCLVLDGVYRRTEGEPAFQAARPTRAELEGLLDKNIVRFMKMLRRLGYAGQKVLSLRTVPGRDEKTTAAQCVEAHGFSLHAGVRCGAHQRKELARRSCRCRACFAIQSSAWSSRWR